MTQPPFDPYAAWLGIPPHEQPPNHYRLLGLRLYESDKTVIEAHWRRRLEKVEQTGSGPHRQHSQRLQTELTNAYTCLIIPARRQAYDQQLRQQLEPPAAAAEPPKPRRRNEATQRTSRQAANRTERNIEFDDEEESGKQRSFRAGKWLLVAAPVVLLAGAGGAFWFLSDTPDDPPGLFRPEPVQAQEHQRVQAQLQTDAGVLLYPEFRFELGESAPREADLEPETGLFLWTPDEQAGDQTFEIPVRLRNAAGEIVAEETLSISVAETNAAPEFSRMPDSPTRANQSLTLQLAATDPDLPAQPLTWTLQESPEGMRLNPTTGELSWRPGSEQYDRETQVIVQVADSGDPPLTCQASFTVNVAAPESTRLELTPQLARVGEKFELSVAERLPSDSPDALKFALESKTGPAADLQPETGLLSWTPEAKHAGQTYEFQIRAYSEGNPQSVPTRILVRLEVQPAAPGPPPKPETPAVADSAQEPLPTRTLLSQASYPPLVPESAAQFRQELQKLLSQGIIADSSREKNTPFAQLEALYQGMKKKRIKDPRLDYAWALVLSAQSKDKESLTQFQALVEQSELLDPNAWRLAVWSHFRRKETEQGFQLLLDGLKRISQTDQAPWRPDEREHAAWFAGQILEFTALSSQLDQLRGQAPGRKAALLAALPAEHHAAFAGGQAEMRRLHAGQLKRQDDELAAQLVPRQAELADLENKRDQETPALEKKMGELQAKFQAASQTLQKQGADLEPVWKAAQTRLEQAKTTYQQADQTARNAQLQLNQLNMNIDRFIAQNQPIPQGLLANRNAAQNNLNEAQNNRRAAEQAGNQAQTDFNIQENRRQGILNQLAAVERTFKTAESALNRSLKKLQDDVTLQEKALEKFTAQTNSRISTRLQGLSTYLDLTPQQAALQLMLSFPESE